MDFFGFYTALCLFVLGTAFGLHCVIAAYEEEARRQREAQAELIREI